MGSRFNWIPWLNNWWPVIWVSIKLILIELFKIDWLNVIPSYLWFKCIQASISLLGHELGPGKREFRLKIGVLSEPWSIANKFTIPWLTLWCCQVSWNFSLNINWHCLCCRWNCDTCLYYCCGVLRFTIIFKYTLFLLTLKSRRIARILRFLLDDIIAHEATTESNLGLYVIIGRNLVTFHRVLNDHHFAEVSDLILGQE